MLDYFCSWEGISNKKIRRTTVKTVSSQVEYSSSKRRNNQKIVWSFKSD